MTDEAQNITPEEEDAGRRGLANLQRGVGEVAMLMARHPTFGGLFLSDLWRTIVPPVTLNQYRIIRDHSGRTRGFVSWALVSEDILSRLMRGLLKLRYGDWQSGEHIVVMDVAAPTAEVGRRFLLELRKHEFTDKQVWVVNPGASPQEPKLRELEKEQQ